MLLGLAYHLTRFLTDLTLVSTGSNAQLRVLERKVGKPQDRPQRSARRFTPRVPLGRLSELTEIGLLHTT